MIEHTCGAVVDGEYRTWLVSYLWGLVKDLPEVEIDPQDLPEYEILMESEPARFWWDRQTGGKGTFTYACFVKHTELVQKADLSYPIILGPNGRILDGLHRVAKAIIERKKLRMVQFTEWPPCG